MKNLKDSIWYERHRPKKLSQLAIPKNYKIAFKKYMRKKEIPHILFYGPAGSGKTTIAMILIRAIASGKLILNASSEDRGIDTIKKKVRQFASARRSEEDKLNIVFFDECFAKGTMITTIDKRIPIEKIKIGDKIQNILGVDIVEKIHINRVPLSRIISIGMNNEEKIICSKDHRFLTKDGWVEAKFLNKQTYLYTAADINNLRKVVYNENKGLRNMWRRLHKQSTQLNVLHRLQITSTILQSMWEKISLFHIKQLPFLFSKLCWEMEKFPKGFSRESIHQKTKQKNIKGAKKFLSNNIWKRTIQEGIRENERKQPYAYVGCCKKNGEKDKKKQNIVTTIIKNTWWKWKTNSITNSALQCFKLANRSSNQNRSLSWRQKWIPNKLQSRYRKQKIKVGNRNRWKDAPNEETKEIRLEKGKETTPVKVESITFYKRGNNDKHFSSIIGDKERNQGYAEFYDLEVKKHPSYIANNCIVHNSHGLTLDAQEALKNTIETYHTNCRFIFACNQIDKMIEPLISRCILYKFDTVPKKKLVPHLNKILDIEEVKYKREDVEKIIEMFYPDVRTIINNLQSCSTGKKPSLDIKHIIDSFNTESIKIYLKEGSILALRGTWSGASDFVWLYRYIFNKFIPKEMDKDIQADAAIIVAEYLYRDRTVADKEINMAALCLELMNLMEVKIDFEIPF